MSEKAAAKKQKTSKAKIKAPEKKKQEKEGVIERDEKGRFVPGKSGNPGGRPKLSEDFEEYAKKAPSELWKLVEDKETGKALKASILQWFAEMYYGRARQQVDLEADAKVSGITEVRFEGEVSEWSE